MDNQSIPILDLSWADDPGKKPKLLSQLRSALFEIGFLYVQNHGVLQSTISSLTNKLPALFELPVSERAALSKLNSPHFLGYSGFAEETTLGKQDLREQFDFATELPVVYNEPTAKDASNGVNGHSNDDGRDFTQLYWRLRGPNQYPAKSSLPGFREAFTAYHDAVAELSYRFVHLIEEAFEIPLGTFDHFFGRQSLSNSNAVQKSRSFLPPQHRIKLLKYPPSAPSTSQAQGQGVGAHKDSSGWLTFLLQVGDEAGLEVLAADDKTWLPAPPIAGTFVVNFGNAFEAATQGAVKATTHRVIAPGEKTRYSVPFFQGLPLDMTVSEVRGYIPDRVKAMRGNKDGPGGPSDAFLDSRWDSLGESQLRKWVRSHRAVAEKWYGREVVEYYTS